MEKRHIYTILLILLLLGSFFIYFYQLKTIPGGLFPDAAANGLDAQLIIKGHNAPFFERGNGREALFFYFMVPCIKFFGINNWSILIPGVLAALLIILGVYLLAKEWFSEPVGLTAALMTAVSYWLLIISRSGFRAIMVPLFLVYFLYFLALAVRRENKTALFAILSGIFFGLGFYSYISYRMVLAVVGFFFILLLVAKYTDRKKYPLYCQTAWWFIIPAVITLLPLIIYFISHPASIVGRAGQVSIFNPELNQGHILATFLTELKRNLLAFWARGDLNWRHNISGYPLIGPITGLFLIGGMTVFLIRSLYFLKNLIKGISFDGLEYFVVFGSFWLMLVPAVMSAEGSPHGLRLLGTLPWLMIMAGWFLITAFNFTLRSIKEKKNKIFAWAGLAVMLLFISIYNPALFWIEGAYSKDYHYAFRKDLTAVSNYLNQRDDRTNTYLALEEYSQQTTEYLTSGNNQPYQSVDLDKINGLNLGPGQTLVFTGSTLSLADQYQSFHPEVRVVKQVFDGQSRAREELMRVYAR